MWYVGKQKIQIYLDENILIIKDKKYIDKFTGSVAVESGMSGMSQLLPIWTNLGPNLKSLWWIANLIKNIKQLYITNLA